MLELQNLRIHSGDFTTNFSNAVWVHTSQLVQLRSQCPGFLNINVLINKVSGLLLDCVKGSCYTGWPNNQGDAAKSDESISSSQEVSVLVVQW